MAKTFGWEPRAGGVHPWREGGTSLSAFRMLIILARIRAELRREVP